MPGPIRKPPTLPERKAPAPAPAPPLRPLPKLVPQSRRRTDVAVDPPVQRTGEAAAFAARAKEYGPFLTYNIPLPSQTARYAAHLPQDRVKFVNPDGLTIPHEFNEVAYAAMCKLPAFMQDMHNSSGKRGGAIEFVFGSCINDPGTLVRIGVLDPKHETQGVTNEGLWKLSGPTIHVMVPAESVFQANRAFNLALRCEHKGDLKMANELRAGARALLADRANDTLLHEAGHHVDNVLGKLSNAAEWKTIFQDPAARASVGDSYLLSNPAEFFADTFRQYVDSPQSREAMDPRVRAFMDQHVRARRPSAPRTTSVAQAHSAPSSTGRDRAAGPGGWRRSPGADRRRALRDPSDHRRRKSWSS